jgi:hypothetical protein
MFIDTNLRFGTLAERTSKQPGMPGTHQSIGVFSKNALFEKLSCVTGA